LNFTFAQGTAPSAQIQSFVVNATPPGTPFAASVSPSSVTWLVAPASGVAGSPYNITLNAAALTQGTYNATLSFTSPSGNAQVPIALTITPPPVIVSQPSALVILGNFGATAATSLTVQLTSTDANLPFTAASNSTWLTFSASDTSTPATLTVSANPAGLAAGTYQGSIVVTMPGAANSPYSIPVRFVVVTSALLPRQTAVDNSASFEPATATPNAILSLFSEGLTCSPPQQVTIGGVVAQVLYSSATQINFVVPDGIPTGATSTIETSCNGTVTNTVTIPQTPADPAIFTQSGTGTGQGSIDDSNGTANTAANPAAQDSYISVYGTGFGPLNAASPDGLRRLVFPVAATIGGVPATVVYAGEAPTETLGLQQVNILVPAGANPGPGVPLVLTVNGVNTQAGVTVAIQ
jgi:uncharacterized protein (TIGR03437 family)